MENNEKILAFDSLLIGYSSGNKRTILLPPITASAKKGELIAVIGQNGIGKSTLLRTFTGLQKSLGGTILINNKHFNLYSRMDFARNIGYISTEIVKVTNMRVYDLVALGRFPYTDWLGKLTEEDQEAVSDAIEKAGLKNFEDRFITELSDGERQRVMIARVLAQDTHLLVMDEPTAFLDVRSKYEIIHLLHDLSKNRGKTIIFSTHDLNIATSEADKIWLIQKESFREGAPEDLILNGAFNSLFNDSKVRFNQTDGSFTFRNELKGAICIKGEGINYTWTEKALNRAGYSVTGKSNGITIEIIPNEDGCKWIIDCNNDRIEFGSVYDLISWISANIK